MKKPKSGRTRVKSESGELEIESFDLLYEFTDDARAVTDSANGATTVQASKAVSGKKKVKRKSRRG